jgi:dUTP pyrophosphatase
MRLKLVSGRLMRSTRESAAFDLFCAAERIIIPVGDRRTIPTGVRTEFDPGYAALLWDKSGYAADLGVTVLGGLIDADYRKEWMVILLNTGKNPVIFNRGDKITQVVFIQLPQIIVGVEEGAECTLKDELRTGGLGSTGRT